jgi:cytochrome c nitrite reductase small subunit
MMKSGQTLAKTEAPMRLRTALVAHPIVTALLLLGIVGVAAGAVPAFQASEKPAFCLSCHEMRPYYDAWAKGAHKSVDCVDCHVDGGTVNHVTHKVEAGKELWIHLTGDPRFPKGGTVVPNARCLTCHVDIPTSGGPGFSHKTHVGKAACIECHSNVGHWVSLEALRKENVLAPSAAASASLAAAAASSSVSASITPTSRHLAIACTQCHVLSKTPCSKCHTPGHAPRGDCAQCHTAGPRWIFTHPVSPDCAACHKAPAKHFGAACSTCHSPSVLFAKTVYVHTSDACASCHAGPPRHHTAVSCQTCHRQRGASWAATHPSSDSCASCHGAPAKHNRVVGCASCHHKPGVSWAASHPASRSCASCHSAPGGHYGSSCASCHRPGVRWSSATFSHPRVTHGFRAFPCAKCHPSGYRSHSCTTCHGPGGGDGGDSGGGGESDD